MQCREVLQKLHDFIDGELEEAEQLRVSTHLEKCASCRGQVDAGRRLKRLVQVKARREPLPPGLEGKIREAIVGETTSFEAVVVPPEDDVPSGLPPRSSRWLPLAAMGLVAVSLLALSPSFLSPEAALVHAQVAEQAVGLHALAGDTPAKICDSCDATAICESVLGAGVLLPVFKNERVRLRGVCTERFGNTICAHLHYTLDDQRFSMFAFQNPEVVHGIGRAHV